MFLFFALHRFTVHPVASFPGLCSAFLPSIWFEVSFHWVSPVFTFLSPSITLSFIFRFPRPRPSFPSDFTLRFSLVGFPSGYLVSFHWVSPAFTALTILVLPLFCPFAAFRQIVGVFPPKLP